MTSVTPPVEEIRDGDTIVAVIIRASFDEPGVRFFSQGNFSQQLGSIQYPAGHSILPHMHNAVSREVMYTLETLFIRSGRVRADLYRSDHTWLTSRDLGPGDVILLATGGHGFEVLEECSMIEVKQGPYAGDADKTRFDPSES